MSFLAPELLLGLLLLPLAAAFYVWTQRRRARYVVRFTNLALLANVAPRTPGWRRHVPPALYGLAMAALLFGLSRPTLVLPTPREDATVVLAMDVSASMNAQDVEPTRLDAAVDAAESFLDQLPNDIRVGLITFSNQPVTLVEPTADREAVREALGRLRADGGTAMGDAIEQLLDIAETVRADETAPSASPNPSAAAESAVPESSPTPDASSTVDGVPDRPSLVAGILLSDGANSLGETDPLDAADRAAALGVPIYTIALGTEDGRVQVRDESGRLVTVDVPPDWATLSRIAETTGAAAFDAPTAEDLRAVYDNLQSRIGYVPREQEVTALVTGGGLAVMAVGAALAALWFGRLP